MHRTLFEEKFTNFINDVDCRENRWAQRNEDCEYLPCAIYKFAKFFPHTLPPKLNSIRNLWPLGLTDDVVRDLGHSHDPRLALRNPVTEIGTGFAILEYP